MNDDIRAKVTQETEEAIAVAGGDKSKVVAAHIVKRHLGDGGASRATLYRLVNGILGKPSLKPIPKVTITTKVPAFRPEITTGPVPGFDKVIGPAGVGLVEALRSCVTAAHDVMAHSRHPDGKVRLGKSLIGASEHLRKTVETVARIHETMVSTQKLGAFYDALHLELEQEAPDLRARVVARLRAVTAKWQDEAAPSAQQTQES